MEFKYHAFSLIWSIPFECPELQRSTKQQDTATADVMVSLNIVNQPKITKSQVNITESTVIIHYKDIGKFTIANGDTIAIETSELNKSVRLLMLNTVASFLLLQRGLLPLHGSGVLYQNEAILFVGNSGYGKSTTAAGFIEKGYSMITDDIAAIDFDLEKAVVIPSFPNMKLWEDSLEMLEEHKDNLDFIRENETEMIKKYKFPVSAMVSQIMRPQLNTIYILNPLNEGLKVTINELSNSEKFNALINYTFQKTTLKKQNLHEAHFVSITKIINQVRIVQLNRPRLHQNVKELVHIIEQDLLNNN